jgi:hypothetical protein
MPSITKSDFIRAMDMIVEAPEPIFNVVYLYKSEMERYGETFRSAGYSVILMGDIPPCPTSEKPQSE